MPRPALPTAAACGTTLTDDQLLTRFVRDRDEVAFAVLVERYGPLVLGAARRLLGDPHSADDVFQAVFLALARSAAAVRDRRALPGWLHRAAVRAAARCRRARRTPPLAAEPSAKSPPPDEDLLHRELLGVLDEEIVRLPESLRLPVVLCTLHGRTREEAAADLGWTVAAVKGRLERGRDKLRRRLVRRGVLGAAGLPLALPAADVAAALRHATVLAVRLGRSSPAVAVPVRALTAKGVAALHGAVLFAAGLILGGFAAVSPTAPPDAAKPPAESPAAKADAEPLPAGAVRRFGTARFRTGSVPVAVSADGTTVTVVSGGGTVRHFDAATGRLRGERHLPLPDTVSWVDERTVRLSRDGSAFSLRVFHANAGSETLVWRTADGHPLWSRKNALESVIAVDHSPDGRHLAVGLVKRAAKLEWTALVVDLTTQETVTLPVAAAATVRLAPDGRHLLCGDITGDFRGDWTCYDVATGKAAWTTAAGRMLSYSPDGTLVFLDRGTEPNGLLVLDAKTGQPAKDVVLPTAVTYDPWPPVVSPKGSSVLLRFPNEDRTVVWDYRAGTVVCEVGLKPVGSQEQFPLATFSPDGLAVYATVGQLQRWDARTGRAAYPNTETDGHTRPITGVKYSADGRELVSVGMDFRYFRWDAATGTPTGSGRAAAGGVLSRLENHLGIAEVESKKMIFEKLVPQAHVPEAGPKRADVAFDRPQDYTVAAAPTADGRRVVYLQDNRGPENRKLTLTVVEREPYRHLSSVTVPWTVNVPRHPFSPCGRWAVVDGRVYHTGTGTVSLRPTAKLDGKPQPLPLWNLRPVGFSPDGRFLIGSLETARPPNPTQEYLAVWELASGRAWPPLPAASEGQRTLSPGGHQVVLAGLHGLEVRDLLAGSVKPFSPRDVSELAVGYADRNQTVAFHPSGKTFVTGHADGTILEWPTPRVDWPAPTMADADAIWAALAADDLPAARGAVERLVQHPAAAVTILSAKFVAPAAGAVDEKQVAGWIGDLDSASFAVREAASKKLKEQGGRVEKALRATLDTSNSPEVRQRVETLLGHLSPVEQLPLTGERLRGVRAVEVLERARTPEARQLLKAWAGQDQNARLRDESRLALARLP